MNQEVTYIIKKLLEDSFILLDALENEDDILLKLKPLMILEIGFSFKNKYLDLDLV